MSLYGSLYSAVSGLKSQSSKIGAISDNISNVNTIGYKGVQGQFQTLLTASSGGAYAPGGVLGVTRQTISKQGLLSSTDSPTDIAISGSGFFVVAPAAGSTDVLYTRAGSFTQDNLGNLRNASGFYLKAWPLDSEGRLPGAPGNTTNANSSSNLSSLTTVNVQSLSGAASATSSITLSANLKATQAVFPGQGVTAPMDAKDTANASNASRDIIIPTTINSIARGDRLQITTGSELNYIYRYGGFSNSRSVTSGSGADNGLSTLATQTTLGTDPFNMTNGSGVITVTQANHGLVDGQVVEISGISSTINGISPSNLNGRYIIDYVDANTYTITLASGITSNATDATSGGTGIVATTRLAAGKILNASSAAGVMLSATALDDYATDALKFTISTESIGTKTFALVSGSPNPTNGTFNSLNTLADAINAVTSQSGEGLTARIVNGKLYVAPTKASEAMTFANGQATGSLSGTTVKWGIDWVRELGFSSTTAVENRFASLDGLSKLVDASTGLNASITNPTSDATLSMNVKDPLDTITFRDPATQGNFSGTFSATGIATTNGSTTVTLTFPAAHGLTTGDIITLASLPAGTYNGLDESDINGAREVTVTSATTVTFTVGAAATSTGTTGSTSLVATLPNNNGSIAAELGLVTSLNGASYSPKTTGSLGPAYVPTDEVKNMAGGEVTPQFTASVQIYDSLGTAHSVRVGYLKTAANTWAVEVYAIPADDTLGTASGQLAYGTLQFNGDGTLRSVSSALTNPITVNWANQAKASSITIDWGTAGPITGTQGVDVFGKANGMSQFDSLSKVKAVTQNGVPVGNLSGISITNAGILVANFDNGTTQSLFKIPLATFINENGLSGVTGNVYRESTESGTVTLREAGDGSAGKISSSSLESSNAELSDQLTDLIIAQRAYQANTKIIQTSDSLLQELNRIGG